MPTLDSILMMSPFAAFKELLVGTPKVDTTSDFDPEDVYQHFLVREQRLDVEAFFGFSVNLLMIKLVERQSTYNVHYSKYKEIAQLLQKKFNSRPS